MLVRERLDVMERERKKIVIYKSVIKGWGNFNLMGYSNTVMEKITGTKGVFGHPCTSMAGRLGNFSLCFANRRLSCQPTLTAHCRTYIPIFASLTDLFGCSVRSEPSKGD